MRAYRRKSRLAGNKAAPSESTRTADACEFNAIPRQLRRRRAAAQRLAPLDCGCPTGPHSDPLSCLCTFPPLTEHQLDEWANTARHLLQRTDGVPLLPIEALRGLYRRGGSDRELAELLHALTGGRVA